MKLILKQRIFSWLDSYDVYDETETVVFSVEGKFGWGHKLHILNPQGEHIATIKEKIPTILPEFSLYIGEEYMGCIQKEWSFFKPKFYLECRGWQVEGDFFEWDYSILDGDGKEVATISKELLNWSDTYLIDVKEREDALLALIIVLAIDAEKCSRN